MSNDNSSISYIKILDTDTRSIEMHRIKCDLVESRNKSKLASSGPYGPLLARSGYPGQDASFYNNPMVMICATVNALTLL